MGMLGGCCRGEGNRGERVILTNKETFSDPAEQAQLKAEVVKQDTEVDNLKAEVDKLKAEEVKQKAEVDPLKQQQLVQQVAFSASLTVGGEEHIGPVPSHTPLIYKYVPTNIGNAYNPTTGLFTAPVKGVYHFDWTVGAFGDGSRGSGAWLVKNSEKVALVFENQMDGFMSGSKGVSLSLLKGDVVFLRLLGNGLVFDDYNCLTTFSGHLLFLL
ncbi:complement C1q tumor necrosis factor-related protein 3-like [Etheostoma cragini]|uniref:complement C1q tumor necrosis factor-related protein 3-like n=1 Tax=Etheostoma cragini TaxID=417921 RepID=UPI00155E9F9F|nr:complement C1q tumor necrosis factor-related protein 3-like [Etheostoma cragini]